MAPGLRVTKITQHSIFPFLFTLSRRVNGPKVRTHHSPTAMHEDNGRAHTSLYKGLPTRMTGETQEIDDCRHFLQMLLLLVLHPARCDILSGPVYFLNSTNLHNRYNSNSLINNFI
jgi:hypothetical protein